MKDERKSSYSFKKINQKQFGNVGYFPFYTEKALSSKKQDFKEFIHFGNGISSDIYPSNGWISSHLELKEVLKKQFEQLEILGKVLFPLISNIYGLKKDYIEDLIKEGNSILRVIHYPPCSSHNNSSIMRAAPHYGTNLMGFAPPSEIEGLQFCLLHTNEWVSMPKINEPVVLVNIELKGTQGVR